MKKSPPKQLVSLAAAAILGYLIGSIPSAYLIVRWKAGIDIREAGSGNVGTLNSYDVTGSKAVGAAVLLADLFKGVAAVLAAGAIGSMEFVFVATGGALAVLGHNFPVWLGFRGGRGLATAAGVMLLIAWVSIPVWGILWGGGYLLLRRVNPANALATGLLIALIFLAPDTFLERFVPDEATPAGFRMFISAILGLVLMRHIRPVLEFVKEQLHV